MNRIMILEGELRARTYSDTLKYVFKNYLLEPSYTVGESNGTPLQYSCLENPRDREPGGLQSMGSLRVGHD